MKTISIVLCVVMFCAAVGAQKSRVNNPRNVLPPGAVSGEIVIKEVSGNGLGKFTCSNLVVSTGELGNGWQRRARAMGEFSKRRCMFVVPGVPAGDPFVAVLHARMPSCDQKTFNTTTSFPMTLKSGEALKYNFEVTKISCVLLK